MSESPARELPVPVPESGIATLRDVAALAGSDVWKSSRGKTAKGGLLGRLFK